MASTIGLPTLPGMGGSAYPSLLNSSTTNILNPVGPLTAAPTASFAAPSVATPALMSSGNDFDQLMQNPLGPVKSLLVDELPVSGSIEDRRKNYNGFQNFLRYAGFPLIMGGGLLAGWQLMEHGMSPGMATTLTTMGTLGLTALIERIIPYRKDWQAVPRDLMLDGAHNLLSTAGFVQFVKHYLAAPAIMGASVYAAQQLAGIESIQAIGESIRATLPFTTDIASWHPLALFTAFLIPTEGLTYLAHRGVHEIPAGWFFHRIHHRPEKMNSLKGGFNNMFDSLKELSHFALPLSAMVLLSGDSPEAMHAFFAATGLIVIMTTGKGFAQHSNADFTMRYKFKLFGKERTLNGAYIISDTEAHRWHHARDERHNTNYGINLMIFDTMSAIPQWTLEALNKAIPSSIDWAGMATAHSVAQYMNSLYLPEKDSPDEVGISPREQKKIVQFPITSEMGFKEVANQSWNQFWIDNFKPVKDLWRGGWRSFIPISPKRADVEPEDLKKSV